MEISVGTAAAAPAPVAVMPSGTAAATVETGGEETLPENEKLNKCKFVDEVVGPPISQCVLWPNSHCPPKRTPPRRHRRAPHPRVAARDH